MSQVPLLPNGKLLDTREAAEYLRRSPITLAEWRQAKRGPPYIRVGGNPTGAVLYRVEDLDAWIESQTVRP
jgi:hypothetical protein